MKMASSLFIIFIINLGFLLQMAQSVRFEVQNGHVKCMSEDIKSNSMTVGKYSVVNDKEGHQLPENHRITVRVTSSFGNSYHQADRVFSGQFAFTAVEQGDYMTCMWADSQSEEKVTIDFDWKTGVAAKDWSNVAKKGQIDVMEVELNKLYETVQSIHEEMFYLREREEEMQTLNRSTTSKMAWLSFASLLICVSVASLQLWHLKTFFERKKLL